MRLLCLLPAAEHFVDGKELYLCEAGGKPRGNGLIARTVIPLGRNFLSLLRVEVLQIRLRYGTCPLAVDDFVDDGHRRLGKNAD